MYFSPPFLQRMGELLGEEAGAFFQALSRETTGFRANTLKISPADFAALSPFALQPVPWCPEGFFTGDRARPGVHPYHAAGLYYLQDPCAMASAMLLDPKPGEWVLDLCAAPGGKSTHLAARMADRGLVVANEVNPRRATVLAMNIERLGVRSSLVVNETPRNLAASWPNLFDKVLIDAPCSGEALFARDRKSARRWSIKASKRFARLQTEILATASPLVRKGGRLLYATCAFSPEEDEGVVRRFLDSSPDFELVAPSIAMDRGHPEWADGDPGMEFTGRFWPHRGPGRGHFYALFERRGQETPPRPQPEDHIASWAREDYRNFCRGHLHSETIPESGLVVRQDQVFWTAMAPELWQHLRVLRPGLWLGKAGHGEFAPDHALAMALTAEETVRTCNLPPDSAEVLKYLRGEELPGEWQDGWVLVGVGRFPLGWAHARRGRLKNFYPRHLCSIPWSHHRSE